MENASKALLMAGGVLIAILIIAVLIRTFTNISSFQKAKLTEEEQNQILAFNEQYTKYVGQYVYGTEVKTLQNKFKNDSMVMIKILPENLSIPTDSTTYFKCTAIEYDSSTGKVNSITFSKVELE